VKATTATDVQRVAQTYLARKSRDTGGGECCLPPTPLTKLPAEVTLIDITIPGSKPVVSIQSKA